MIYKPFKINRNKYNNVYFLSDAHINHDRPWIVQARGFDSIEKHDSWITNQLYSLTEDDLLINLGDFTLASSVEYTKKLLQNIRATHYYAAWGNHESFASKIYYEVLHSFWKGIGQDTLYSPVTNLSNRSIELYPLTVSNDLQNVKLMPSVDSHNEITFFGESVTFNIGRNFYYCRHMIAPIWDTMKYDGGGMIHGHSHSNLVNSQPNDTQGKVLDVGVDNAKKYNGTCFFTLEEIDQIMKHKINLKLDHH